MLAGWGATCATLLCPHLESTEHVQRSVEWLGWDLYKRNANIGAYKNCTGPLQVSVHLPGCPECGGFWDIAVLRNRAFSALSGIKDLSRAVTDFVCDTRHHRACTPQAVAAHHQGLFGGRLVSWNLGITGPQWRY